VIPESTSYCAAQTKHPKGCDCTICRPSCLSIVKTGKLCARIAGATDADRTGRSPNAFSSSSTGGATRRIAGRASRSRSLGTGPGFGSRRKPSPLFDDHLMQGPGVPGEVMLAPEYAGVRGAPSQRSGKGLHEKRVPSAVGGMASGRGVIWQPPAMKNRRAGEAQHVGVS